MLTPNISDYSCFLYIRVEVVARELLAGEQTWKDAPQDSTWDGPNDTSRYHSLSYVWLIKLPYLSSRIQFPNLIVFHRFDVIYLG